MRCQIRMRRCLDIISLTNTLLTSFSAIHSKATPRPPLPPQHYHVFVVLRVSGAAALTYLKAQHLAVGRAGKKTKKNKKGGRESESARAGPTNTHGEVEKRPL